MEGEVNITAPAADNGLAQGFAAALTCVVAYVITLGVSSRPINWALLGLVAFAIFVGISSLYARSFGARMPRWLIVSGVVMLGTVGVVMALLG
jgi:hypothetical protein